MCIYTWGLTKPRVCYRGHISYIHCVGFNMFSAFKKFCLYICASTAHNTLHALSEVLRLERSLNITASSKMKGKYLQFCRVRLAFLNRGSKTHRLNNSVRDFLCSGRKAQAKYLLSVFTDILGGWKVLIYTCKKSMKQAATFVNLMHHQKIGFLEFCSEATKKTREREKLS